MTVCSIHRLLEPALIDSAALRLSNTARKRGLSRRFLPPEDLVADELGIDREAMNMVFSRPMRSETQPKKGARVKPFRTRSSVAA
jgi:hypothetical protein